MYLAPQDSAAVPAQILTKGHYEKEELSMVRKVVKHFEGSFVFFDVGANLGWYGMNVKIWHPESNVIFFEPVPQTAERLRANLELNKMDGCRVLNIGLYDENKTAGFYYDVTASGASSLADLKEKPTTRLIEVSMRRLDDVACSITPALDRLDFIKCDVEGAELFVYKGGVKTIRKYKPVIFSEMLRKWSRKQGYHPNDIIELLREMGYDCFVIEKEGLKRFEEVTEETVETNYFFMHRKHHAGIIEELSV